MREDFEQRLNQYEVILSERTQENRDLASKLEQSQLELDKMSKENSQLRE